jgi:hypothetical protein
VQCQRHGGEEVIAFEAARVVNGLRPGTGQHDDQALVDVDVDLLSEYAYGRGAFDLVGSRGRDCSRLVRREAWIPPDEVASQQAVDVTDPDLQEPMCAEWVPSHLLRLGHALVDDLVDSRFDEGARDALAAALAFAVVRQ